jgi:hypothetical protein
MKVTISIISLIITALFTANTFAAEITLVNNSACFCQKDVATREISDCEIQPDRAFEFYLSKGAVVGEKVLPGDQVQASLKHAWSDEIAIAYWDNDSGFRRNFSGLSDGGAYYVFSVIFTFEDGATFVWDDIADADVCES